METRLTQDSTRSEDQRQLNTTIRAGYRLIWHGQTAAGCDKWLRAWEAVKQLTAPDIRGTADFDRRYQGLSEYVSNWCQEFEMELGNAGRDDPRYHVLSVATAATHDTETSVHQILKYPNFDHLIKSNEGQYLVFCARILGVAAAEGKLVIGHCVRAEIAAFCQPVPFYSITPRHLR